MPSPSIDPQQVTRFELASPPPGFVDNPYPWYAALRELSPVHRLGEAGWLLTRYDDVVAVYRHPAASSDKQREFGPKFGVGTPLFEHHTTSLVFNDPPLHTRVRRLLMGALSQRAISRMEASVEALVDRLLDDLSKAPDPCLIEDFAAGIPVDVIGNLLDIPSHHRVPLRAWSLDILSALEPAPEPERLARGHRAVTEFSALLREVVAHRRQHPGNPETDVLTRLLQGDGGQGAESHFSESELVHNCIFLLNAGHETTTNLIGNGLHALLTHPDQHERLLTEPQLINSAVEEMLRFESPLQLNNRRTTAPMALPSGVELPADQFVTLGVAAANRDPRAFEQPERFDIGRKPNLHVAFGHATHACSGMNVARLEARVAIGQLLARYPSIRLNGDPQRDPRVRFRGFRRLPVHL